MPREVEVSEEAFEVFEDLHEGRGADQVHLVESVRHAGEELVELGELVELTYRTRKGLDPDTDYVHTFGEEGGKLPTLAADVDGALVIVGGAYRITERGIVD